MDRVASIRAFVEVSERRSFAEAARRLRRSPTAVTRAIGDLEARLGTRLLHRTTRAVSLTEAGERFRPGARRVLADLEEMERAAVGEGSAPRGELRLTAPILFGRLHVLPIVTEFLSRFPAVSVTLSLLDRPVDLVEEGFDVAVRIGLLPESSAIASRVGAVRRIVVASADYLAQHGAPAVPADLARHAIVAFSGVAGVEQWAFRGTAREGNVAINPRLVVTTAEAALDAARYQAAQDIARGSLLRLLPAHEGDELPIHLLYPSGRHLAPKLRAFVDFASPRLRRRCEAITRAIHS